MVMVIMVVDILAKEMVRVVVETLMLMLTLDVVYGKDDDDDDDDDDHRVRLFLQDTSPQKLARAGCPEPNWDVKEPAIATKFAN